MNVTVCTLYSYDIDEGTWKLSTNERKHNLFLEFKFKKVSVHAQLEPRWVVFTIRNTSYTYLLDYDYYSCLFGSKMST